jgi:hypothetical protein
MNILIKILNRLMINNCNKIKMIQKICILLYLKEFQIRVWS